MSIRRTLTTLAMVATFALSIAPVRAQESDSGMQDLAEFDGIQEAVARTWTIDMDALANVTPEPGKDPFADLTGTLLVFGVVAQFEDEDAAKAGFEQFSSADDADLNFSDSEDAVVERGEVKDIGDEAFKYQSTSASDGSNTVIEIVRDNEYLFMAASTVMGDASADNSGAEDLLGYMLDDGDKGGDAEFNEDGGSTGGLWDFFPDDDFDAVADLVPAGDQQLFPVPEGE